jgi:heme-degrading monooxygenase HmoA
MYVVVRRYSGASQLADMLAQRQSEVTTLLKGVPGFKAYYAVRGDDGTVATVTVCDDKAGTDESIRVAADWVRKNLSGASISPPQITAGEAILNF